MPTLNTAHSLNLLNQTAALRFSPKWESVRQLLATRGVAAAQTILFSCDHAGGPDMSVWFALPDGSIIDAILRKDAASLRYTAIVQWRPVEPTGDEMLSVSGIGRRAGFWQTGRELQTIRRARQFP